MLEDLFLLKLRRPVMLQRHAKDFCNVYATKISSVPISEVPSLLSSCAKPFEISPGTRVHMKSGNYKGDLAQAALFNQTETALILMDNGANVESKNGQDIKDCELHEGLN